jgi:ATP-binding cassette subfamily B protein AbcA/BmrA
MPVTQIAQFFSQVQKARGATDSILEILTLPVEDPGLLPVPAAGRGALEFEGVSFGYEPDRPVLKDLNFALEPGTVTAVMGPSGGGKTTVFSLVERFYRPDAGVVLWDGVDVSEFDLNDWRSRIGYVPQDCPLMAGTIRDNLTYGLGEVTEDELREAVAAANATEFTAALPEGLDTQVGERGVKLSGGQRQRLAIARALLRNPAILMLDEATASLDAGSERAVQEALDTLMRGRTTLVIAHRLSTVVGADRILFLEDGRITGSGTHEELVQTHQLYRTFAEQQLRWRATMNQESVSDGTVVGR